MPLRSSLVASGRVDMNEQDHGLLVLPPYPGTVQG